MEVTYETVERLQGIFEEGWNRVKDGAVPVCVPPEEYPPDPQDVWVLWMNVHDVLVIEQEDLLENFDEMVNFGRAVKESACLQNPADTTSYLLVPWDVVEKCLVLGVLA